MRWASLGAQDSREIITHANDPPILDVRLHLLLVLGDRRHVLFGRVHVVVRESCGQRGEGDGRGMSQLMVGKVCEEERAVRNLKREEGVICAEAILVPVRAMKQRSGLASETEREWSTAREQLLDSGEDASTGQ